MNLRVERIPLDGPPLAITYVQDYRRVGAFYSAGPPDDPDSYRRVAELARRTPPARWDAIREAFDDLRSDARARLEELVRRRGVFVATGQQAGLFVSPLLTLYKALTAARLAERLEPILGVPVMPLFSIASEDHDWKEVNHTHVIDLENRLVRLSVEGPDEGAEAPHPPVERVRLGGDIEAALDRLSQCIPETEFKASALESLREAYRPGRGFAEAFQDALSALLAGHGCLVVRTAHPYVKVASRDVLWHEWEAREEVGKRLLARVHALEAEGFRPQVPVSAGATNLFVEGRLGRDRLLWEGEIGRLRRSGERLDGTALRELLESRPDRVSPGALLRPVTEARAFPVVAYVGGPSEVAYLAESQVLFELHGVPAPVVVPRAAFHLIEPKVARVLEKYGIEPRGLAGGAGSVVKRLIVEQTPPALQESLAALRRDVSEALDRVEEVALDFDAGARSVLGSGRRAVFDSVERLEEKLAARVRQKHEVLERQVEKAVVNLYPAGKPQERMLNPYPYLARYGVALLAEIYDRVRTPLD
jgi:bacillithiol biosynthesis cysteine-adding enzyme BshC